MATGLPLKLWTIDEYEEMIARGILGEDDRVELIRGEIVEMTPIGMRHAGCVTSVQRIFDRLPEDLASAWVQNPVRLPNGSMPQPDITLLKGPVGPYKKRRPIAEDVIVAVEVSDSSLRSDRSVKLPIYAEAGILEAWIVNLEDDVIEVYSEPSYGMYQKVLVAGKGSAIPLPAGLLGVISVDEVLG
jgi:Uma2 family endonuclease